MSLINWNNTSRLPASICAGVLALIPLTAAWGQSAPSLTVPSLPAPERGVSGAISLPAAAPENGPPGGEKIALTLKDITLEGTRPSTPELADLWSALLGQTLTVAQLYQLAGKIEQRYSAAGYPFIRVVIPAQDFDASAATVRINIISGVITRTDLAGLPPRLRNAVARQMAPLIGLPFVRYEEIERQLLQAGDLAGATFRAAIGPGEANGEVVLILSAESPLWSLNAAADNSLSRALGDRQLLLQSSLNSPLGLGERIRMVLALPPNLHALDSDAPRRFASVGFNLPVGERGLMVGADVSNSKTLSGAGTTRFKGTLDRLALTASYPLWLRRASSVFVNAELEKVDESLTALVTGGKISQDGVVSVQGSVEARTCALNNQCYAGEVSLRRGLDALGARNAGDVARTGIPFSKGEADNQFTVLGLTLRAGGPLTDATDGLTWRVSARAQDALGATLFTSQQFGVSGMDSVSGLDGGSISGDKGYWARAELGAPVLRIAPTLTLAPYTHYALGSARIERPTAAERVSTEAQSVGIGVRFSLQSEGVRGVLTGSIELAHTRTNAQGSDRDGANNLGFRLGVSF